MNFSALQAAQGYNLAKTAIRNEETPRPEPASAPPAENAAFKVVHALTETIGQGEKAAMAHMSTGADPHAMVEAIAAAELAVETAVVIRDKVVEAYQELIRLPV